MNFQSDESKWNQILARNSEADGNFVYAVTTTGIYCRPSCASRLPLRKNVAFHDSCADAERVGFRACKRCQPNGHALPAHHADLVAKACRIIDAAEEAPRLEELARTAGMSPFHFQRTFKKITGLSPKAYALARRAGNLRARLPRSRSVTQAIYAAGYNSSGRFYAGSTRALGMSPNSYRRGGAGVTIRFAVGECSLGSVLVASSDKGVCAILLGSDPDELTRDLQDRFPEAQLRGGEHDFEQLVARVVGLVENPHLGAELPLDIRGTVFQQRVWQTLGEIPVGETASYTEIARRIGMPKAVRAVAGACGANALAVAIPCHRVVRTDGGLSGYRWGVERKRALLLKEKLPA